MSNATQVIKALENAGAAAVMVKHYRPAPTLRNPGRQRLVWAVTWVWDGHAYGKTIEGGSDGAAALHREIERRIERRATA